ncbi:uncharacterized protein LOC141909982 [Tubulanus polymorphus]|uniref:uncharacterized protein LOC141909982 n=1 Tax=Tubulanus polymorphus TaxID=672921 RepID=UPI003DA42960
MSRRVSQRDDARNNWDDVDRAVVNDLPCCSKHWVSFGPILHVLAFAVSILPIVFIYLGEQTGYVMFLGFLYVGQLIVYSVALIISLSNYYHPAGRFLKRNFRCCFFCTMYASTVIGFSVNARDIAASVGAEKCYDYRGEQLKEFPTLKRECDGYLMMSFAAIPAIVAAVTDLMAAVPTMICTKIAIGYKRKVIRGMRALCDPSRDITVNGPTMGDEMPSERARPFQAIHLNPQDQTRTYEPRILDYSTELGPARLAETSRRRRSEDNNPSAAAYSSPPPSYEQVVPAPPPTYDDAIAIDSSLRTTSV